MQWDSKYTRVTEVLAPFSGLNHIDPRILKHAGERGERVHLACNAIIDKLDYIIDPETEGYVESFHRWMEQEIRMFLPSPKRMFCDDYLITGEADRIYLPDGNFKDLTLVDFKTSAKESKTWGLQGSAYSYLYKKNGYDITNILFVKLDKRGKAPSIFCYEENFKMFLKCLDVYRYFHK